MTAKIFVEFTFGTFGFPSNDSEYIYHPSIDPKEFLKEKLKMFLDPIHFDTFMGASLYLSTDTLEIYYKYKINKNLFNLTKEMDFLLVERKKILKL